MLNVKIMLVHRQQSQPTTTHNALHHIAVQLFATVALWFRQQIALKESRLIQFSIPIQMMINKTNYYQIKLLTVYY